MIAFLQEFNTLMLLVLLGMFLIITAVTSAIKEQRDAAREERDSAVQALALARSSGADLAPKVGWRKQRFMNKPEYALYLELQRLVARGRDGHRLFAQVSFGAFVEATARADLQEIKQAAFYSVQRKVADFLIIDKFGQPVIVIEYQGDGHYQGNAHDRDHAKRVACQKAGIGFLEVPASGLTHGQRLDLGRILGTVPALAAE